jgi:hypothetical protein
MSVRRTLGAALAAVTALFIAASFAGAAKIPTYHVYRKCSTNITCSGAVYLNKSQTRVIAAQVSRKCKDGSWAAINFSGNKKVSRKGKFKVTADASNWDVTNQVNVAGTGTIKGTVKRSKKRLTLKYSIDKFPPGCGSLGKGTLKLKYKGTQSGG